MCKFIMMIGIPGSGKSTYAEKIASSEEGIVISSDKLREELFGNVWEIEKNAFLFSEMFRRTQKYLNEGKNVIFDATNIRSSERKRILRKYKEAFKVCYYIKPSLDKVLYQNSRRDRVVPEEVIMKMYHEIQEPVPNEGWDEIHVIES